MRSQTEAKRGAMRSQTETERKTQKKQTNNAVSFLVTGHERMKKRKETSPQEGLKAAAARTQSAGPQLLPQTQETSLSTNCKGCLFYTHMHMQAHTCLNNRKSRNS